MKIDNRTKRLIAVGASLTANCEPCLRANVAKAKEEGIDEQEIAEAIEIGKLVRQGATSNLDKFASSLNQTVTPTAGPSNRGCACG
jgi:AhpD family alkylhydroperoxidase